MEQFDLEKWLENPSRKVITRLGNREVRIICCDRKNNNNRPIITLMIDPDGNEYTTFHTKNGFVDETEKHIDKRDLFFADEEKDIIRVFKSETDEEPETIVIPFGAKDSEFVKGEYYIPKGCEARIEGNKVIIERVQKEEELSTFEEEVAEAYEWVKTTEREDFVNEFAPKLLDLAKKELQIEFEVELDRAYKCADKVQYENGKKDAMKNIPTWKKASEYKEFDKHVILLESDNRVCLTEYVSDGEYYIELDDLKKLPKEE